MVVQQDVSIYYILILKNLFFFIIIAGGLASDELFLLDLREGDNKAQWMNVHLEKGPTPGKRYGHSLVYYKPFFILFGGNLNNEVANDVWIFNS